MILWDGCGMQIFQKVRVMGCGHMPMGQWFNFCNFVVVKKVWDLLGYAGMGGWDE